MKNANRFAPWLFLGTVLVTVGCFSVFPTTALAQGQGNNAVYNSSGNCSNCLGSGALIDASVFTSLTRTFCSTLYNILSASSYPSSTGTVIDARGLNSGNTNMTCATGWTPWYNGSAFVNVPSTILLPAGTIVIPTTWVLPNNTTLIGVGDALPSTSSASSTTIQACLHSTNSCSFTGTDMIDLGTSLICDPLQHGSVCDGLSVENLVLDGQGQTLNGIVNTNAQNNSSVDHVSLYQLLGTGLSVSTNANYSGPYSNITFNTGGTYSSLSSTVCASINGLNATGGIHGLSCISGSNTPQAAVLLDSSNNSIEDVRIVGFYDGIRVGANANAQSNVLVNIIGDTSLPGGLTPIVIVHITNSGNTVTDLSIMGANNAGGSSGTITIKDDLTGTQLVDTSVAVYALGKSVTNAGYSRFTTSPNAATWGVGAGAPSTSDSCAPGSLYSNTTASGTQKALYVCLYNTSTWSGVK